MREKCARVLAAALMTGAVGFALAMPAFFGSRDDIGRALTTPPSFLQHSVDLVASAPTHPARTNPLEVTQVFRPVVHPTARVVHARPRPARPSKPAPKPTPAPTPAPTRGLASETPAATAAPAAAPSQAARKGNGKGKG